MKVAGMNIALLLQQNHPDPVLVLTVHRDINGRLVTYRLDETVASLSDMDAIRKLQTAMGVLDYKCGLLFEADAKGELDNDNA